jgi:beta-glucanase (GH16 family)
MSTLFLLAGCGQPAPAPPSLSPRPSSPLAQRPSAPVSTAPTTGVLLDEDFGGSRLDGSVWTTCYWWDDHGCTITSNNELQWYRPEGVRVSGGALQLVAERGDQRASDGTTYPFRSGMVTTGPARDGDKAKLAFTYGTVDARLRVPTGRGLWSAMWLLPASQDSRPEIDVMEILGNDPSEAILHLHPSKRNAASPGKTVTVPGVDFSKGWHDFRLDWTPGRLDYLIDGQRVWRLTGKHVPAEPMYLIFNLAVGGSYPGDPDDRTEFPATFAIDHVKITAPA